jgi:hypothetical protein
MTIGIVFGRLLVVGALATAVFTLAAGTGMLPAAAAHGHRADRGDHSHRDPDALEMSEIAGVLREVGFSEPHSMEREHGVIEVKAIGRDGRRYEIYIDPKTGKILEMEEDD